MNEPGWAAFLGNHRTEETPLERSSRLARQAAEQQDRADAAAEAERAAALQERRELQQVAALHAGMTGRSVGDVFAEAGRQGDEDAEYAEAQRTIERIGKRREARRQAMADQAQRMAEVTSLASRSAPTATGNPDLLAEAKQLHREFAAATRAARNQVATPRPKGHGGHTAVRSETVCPRCQLPHERYGMTEAECFLICKDPAPPAPPAVMSEEELEWHGRQTGQPYRPAERRGHGSYAEISR